jgi:hypothetical protein
MYPAVLAAIFPLCNVEEGYKWISFFGNKDNIFGGREIPEKNSPAWYEYILGEPEIEVD